MKKQLLLSAVALFSVVGVSAQLATITQEWKTPVGDATNMRQGTYANGKFYIQNKMMVLSMYGLKTEKNLH